MPTAQIQCQGCDRTFTPSGIGQHITKTWHLQCQTVHAASQSQPSCEIVTTNEGEFSRLLAGVSTNMYVPDSDMNGPENGPDDVHDTPNAVDTNATDTTDAANTTDANTYEILAHIPSLSGVVIPEEAPAIELSEPMELPEYLPIQWEADSELAFDLVIDRLPHGNPGAPILGMQQDPMIYEST
jgi:hypothetical protein